MALLRFCIHATSFRRVWEFEELKTYNKRFTASVLLCWHRKKGVSAWFVPHYLIVINVFLCILETNQSFISHYISKDAGSDLFTSSESESSMDDASRNEAACNYEGKFNKETRWYCCWLNLGLLSHYKKLVFLFIASDRCTDQKCLFAHMWRAIN